MHDAGFGQLPEPGHIAYLRFRKDKHFTVSGSQYLSAIHPPLFLYLCGLQSE